MEPEQIPNTTKRKISWRDLLLAVGLGGAQYLYLSILTSAVFVISMLFFGGNEVETWLQNSNSAIAFLLNEWFPRLITSMAVSSWVHPILGLLFWTYLFAGKIFGKIKNRRAIYFIFFFLSPIVLAILLSPIMPEFSCC